MSYWVSVGLMTVTVFSTPFTHGPVAGEICALRADENIAPTDPEKSVLSRLPCWISDIAESAPVCAASCDDMVPPEPPPGAFGSGPPAPPPEHPASAIAA